jgi:hypothetical protein
VRPKVVRPRWPGRRKLRPEDIDLLGPLPLPLDGDVIGSLGIVAIGIAALVILIPLLLFGIELVLFAIGAGVTLLGSLLLAPRWLIRATNTCTGGVFEQEITGPRASRVAVQTLAKMIRAGQAPPGSGASVTEADRAERGSEALDG